MHVMASANRSPCVLDRPSDEVLASDNKSQHEPVGIALGSLDGRCDVAFGNTVGEVGMIAVVTAPTHNGVSRTQQAILDEQVFCVLRSALHAPDGNEPNRG